MPKFVIIGKTWGGFLPSAEAYGAILSRDISQCYFMRKILRVSVSEYAAPLLFRKPLKDMWHKFILHGEKLSDNEDIYFILCQNFLLASSVLYLSYLREKYRNAKMILLFRDSFAGGHASWAGIWETLRKYYDAGITFNRPDAEKYNLLLTDRWPGLLPQKEYQPEKARDIFFVGRAKDRLPFLLKVYERLTEAGLKCDFWITGVPEDKQKYSGSIHYNSPIPYDETCQRAKNSKCVLEVLPYGQNYSSIRPLEAITYHRKLLTTNINAPSEWFYNPEFVQVFSDPSEIDTDFITRPLSPEDERRIFGGLNVEDFSPFADFIIRNVHRKDS